MSLLSMLRNRCTILRPTITVSAKGIPQKTFATVASSVPCLKQDKIGRTNNTANGIAIEFDTIVFLPVGTDVRPSQGTASHPDQIVVDGAKYTVQAVTERSGHAHHLTCYLKGFREPAAA